MLYVEDNAMDADLTRAIIEKVAPQFNIDVVTTGTAGLAQLQEFIYDIVLLDNRLPDMNGLEVLAQLTPVAIPVEVTVLLLIALFATLCTVEAP